MPGMHCDSYIYLDGGWLALFSMLYARILERTVVYVCGAASMVLRGRFSDRVWRVEMCIRRVVVCV